MPFQKGNKHGKGRVKGSKNHLVAAKIQATVNAQVMDKMEAMLNKATAVVEERLDDGDLNAAIYVLDKLSKTSGGMLPQAIDFKLSTIDDVIHAAQLMTEMVLMRKLTIEEGQKGLNLLSSYSSFRAFDRIEELHAVVEEMKRATEAKTVNSQAVMPSWGRLSADSETANSKPAE